MFFVALWDGSGAHYFSKTNAEHDKMKLKVRAESKTQNW
jgi:cell division protein YceG involved in septum cleavage